MRVFRCPDRQQDPVHEDREPGRRGRPRLPDYRRDRRIHVKRWHHSRAKLWCRSAGLARGYSAIRVLGHAEVRAMADPGGVLRDARALRARSRRLAHGGAWLPALVLGAIERSVGIVLAGAWMSLLAWQFCATDRIGGSARLAGLAAGRRIGAGPGRPARTSSTGRRRVGRDGPTAGGGGRGAGRETGMTDDVPHPAGRPR